MLQTDIIIWRFYFIFSARKHLGYQQKDGVGVIKFDTPDSKVLGILL